MFFSRLLNVDGLVSVHKGDGDQEIGGSRPIPRRVTPVTQQLTSFLWFLY